MYKTKKIILASASPRRKELLEKAGAYAIQGLGAAIVKKIEGDYNNVVGLPVNALMRELRKIGV